jgi:hypothetical protein
MGSACGVEEGAAGDAAAPPISVKDNAQFWMRGAINVGNAVLITAY